MFGSHQLTGLPIIRMQSGWNTSPGKQIQVYGNRCSVKQMVSRLTVHVPALLSHRENEPKDEARKSKDDVNSPLAMETLILWHDRSKAETTIAATGELRHPLSRTISPSGCSPSSSDSLAVKRDVLAPRGTSSKVIGILLSSRRGSTLKSYFTGWTKFSSWCRAQSKSKRSWDSS